MQEEKNTQEENADTQKTNAQTTKEQESKLKAYNKLADKYPKAVVGIKEGNFFHMFAESAWVAANVTGIKCRDFHNTSQAGFPVDSLKKFATKLYHENVDYVFLNGEAVITEQHFKDNRYPSFRFKPLPKPEPEGFRLIHQATNFTAHVYEAFKGCDKGYRTGDASLVGRITQLSDDLVDYICIGNTRCTHGSPERRAIQKLALETAEKINRRIPVAGNVRCISIAKEAQLAKEIDNIIGAIENWQKGNL